MRFFSISIEPPAIMAATLDANSTVFTYSINPVTGQARITGTDDDGNALASITVPDTFPQWDTVRQILNGNAVSAMVALALVVPMSAGVFDISVAYTMSLSGVVAAWLVVHTGLPLGVVIVLGVLTGTAVGIINGIVVVLMRIDSLIATLATG